MITDIMERHIKNICSEYGTYIVNKLSVKYGFDAEEAIREFELPTVKRADAAPRRKEAIEKKPKAAKAEKTPVPSIPLPFCGQVVDGWCKAIVKNCKLYTQCTNTPTKDETLCNKCNKIVEKDGELPFGLIDARTECEPMSFKDPKGNAPVLYSTVMAKLKITREQADTEAAKFGFTIPEEQFVVVEKARGRPKKTASAENSDDETTEKKARGRPKKDKPVKASSKIGDDIIAGLLKQAKENGELEDDDALSSQNSSEADAVPVVEKKAPAPKKPKMTDEEKAAAKEAAKAAKEAEKEAAKAAKEAEKAAAKAAKEAEKAAAKEAEKAALKAAKEAAKQSAKETEKAAKAATAVVAPPLAVAAVEAPKKQLKGGVAETKSGEDEEEEEESYEEESSEEEEEAPEEIKKVKKFEHEGKKYKRSEPDNILYDWETDEPIGVWNTKTKKIDELPDDEDDEDSE